MYFGVILRILLKTLYNKTVVMTLDKQILFKYEFAWRGFIGICLETIFLILLGEDLFEYGWVI